MILTLMSCHIQKAAAMFNSTLVVTGVLSVSSYVADNKPSHHFRLGSPQDWPGATIGQIKSVSSSPLGDQFIGLFSSEMPSFPVPADSVSSVLPSPAGNGDVYFQVCPPFCYELRG
jgi:hypothetical protein